MSHFHKHRPSDAGELLAAMEHLRQAQAHLCAAAAALDRAWALKPFIRYVEGLARQTAKSLRVVEARAYAQPNKSDAVTNN